MGQGGNVYEWEETDFFDFVNHSSSSARWVRGGDSDFSFSFSLSSSNWGYGYGTASGDIDLGFRVASNIPEPSTLLLLCFGSLAVLWRRRSLVCGAVL
jgi:hypothetical protein